MCWRAGNRHERHEEPGNQNIPQRTPGRQCGMFDTLGLLAGNASGPFVGSRRLLRGAECTP